MFSVDAWNAQSSWHCLVADAVVSCSTCGPAAPKLRSPKLLCVRGTRHVLAAAERSWRRSLSVTTWMSSAMYAGVLVGVLVLYFLFRINSIQHRWDTRAQGTTFTSDVIWRHRPPPVTSRAHVTARTQRYSLSTADERSSPAYTFNRHVSSTLVV